MDRLYNFALEISENCGRTPVESFNDAIEAKYLFKQFDLSVSDKCTIRLPSESVDCKGGIEFG